MLRHGSGKGANKSIYGQVLVNLVCFKQVRVCTGVWDSFKFPFVLELLSGHIQFGLIGQIWLGLLKFSLLWVSRVWFDNFHIKKMEGVKYRVAAQLKM